MNWNHELIDSGLWLLQVYGVTLILAVVVIWGLTRFTVWGRQFWDLTGQYFHPRHHWRPLATSALILFLTLGAVRLDVLFSDWYNTMYTALQKLDQPGFWIAMLIFGILATSHVVRSLFDFYIQQAFSIRWRVWLNEKLLDGWLDQQSYYRTQYLDTPVDNPDQRIQQDLTTFVTMSLSLSMGMISALVSTFAFTAILWSLSGPLTLMGLEIPRAMVFLVFIYVIIATIFAIYIGRPLILLNFLTERFNADYRYSLVRLREYSESIAFYAGEKVEGVLLYTRFGHVINNAWAVVYRSLKLLGFNFAITQAAVVFPFVIQASRFFSKQISLGDLMQTAQAFGRLQDSLSFFRNAYDDFATYRATLNRLSGFTKAINDAHKLPEPHLQYEEKRLAVEDLTVQTPDGALLLKDLQLEVLSGQPLLIRGPSGSGKTTLLRSIAGLWPYCSGRIIRPEHDILFLSQKPYLPLGSLRDALYYPRLLPTARQAAPGSDIEQQEQAARTAAHSMTKNLDDLVNALGQEQVAAGEAIRAQEAHAADSSDNAQRVLKLVQLEHLTDRLDRIADWGRILSLGEQQRLAFGRLLLATPQAALLDEATSAMDEGLEDAMYRLIRQHLPDTLLVSVGHRSTLFRHHPHQLVLKGDGTGAWEMLVSPHP